jgi:hypothetical protein
MVAYGTYELKPTEIRKDKTMSPAEKTQQLRLLTKQQNQIKSAFTTAIAGYDEDFGDLIYD